MLEALPSGVGQMIDDVIEEVADDLGIDRPQRVVEWETIEQARRAAPGWCRPAADLDEELNANNQSWRNLRAGSVDTDAEPEAPDDVVEAEA